MLTLRPKQVLALARVQLATERARALVDQLVPWARSAYWDIMIERTDDDVRAMLRAIIARSLAFGLERIEDHREFVDLELAHGPWFEEQSRYLRQMLADPELPGGAKIALARHHLEQR